VIRWQFFPRSMEPPPHLLAAKIAFETIAPALEERYAAWEAWAANPSGKGPRLESNTVLEMVRPSLEAAGYAVERKGHPLPFVVLWGENGKPAKAYEADAKIEHESGRETVVEVEAGGATANNLWRKDLMEASLMPYVDYLAIAVRQEYKHRDSKTGKVKVNPDFERVRSELDALYESHRLHLPLTGILLIGY
jgi:hypothetical protein